MAWVKHQTLLVVYQYMYIIDYITEHNQLHLEPTLDALILFLRLHTYLIILHQTRELVMVSPLNPWKGMA